MAHNTTDKPHAETSGRGRAIALVGEPGAAWEAAAVALARRGTRLALICPRRDMVAAVRAAARAAAAGAAALPLECEAPGVLGPALDRVLEDFGRLDGVAIFCDAETDEAKTAEQARAAAQRLRRARPRGRLALASAAGAEAAHRLAEACREASAGEWSARLRIAGIGCENPPACAAAVADFFGPGEPESAKSGVSE